jgi:hypothetical protein
VGKTSADGGVAGFEARSTGETFATSSGATLYAKRTTGDGDIVVLQGSSGTVGGIGTGGGRPYFVANNGSTGGGFKVDSTQFYPVDRTGVKSDGVLDLGLSSGRWKDLYLSGGVSNPSGALTFDTTGGEAMRIDASGNVGIGTTSPTYLLDMESTVTGLTHNLKLNKGSTTGDYAEIAFQLWSGAGTGLNTFGGSGTSRPSVVLRAVNEAANSAAGAFVVGTFAGGGDNTNLTEKFRITSTGNVGIGTDSPQGAIHVRRTGTATLVLEGDTNNSGDAGERDVEIFMLTDGGAGNDPFGGTTYGAHGYRISAQNYPGKVSLGFDEWHSANGFISRMQIDEDGNVGIGTASPTARFDVRRGDASGKIAEFHQNTGYGIDIGSSQSVAYISSGYNQRLDFKTDPTTGQTERMSILANGNVGIGSISPSNQLEVTGGTNKAVISVTNADLGSIHYTDRNGRYLTSNGSGWTTGVDGADPGIVIGSNNSSGEIKGVGIVLHNDNNSDNQYSPTISFGNKSNSGSYNTAYAHIIGRKTGQGVDPNWSAGEIGFYTQPVGGYVTNAARLIIKSDGKVGIGTTSPSYSLQVQGTGYFDGALTTNGQINTNNIQSNGGSRGLVLGNFTTSNADQWPLLTWANGTGYDEGLIHGASNRGVFGRAHFGIHFHDDRSFAFHTTSWDTEMEINGDGRTYMKGPVGINITPSSTTDSRLRVHQTADSPAMVITSSNPNVWGASLIIGNTTADQTLIDGNDRPVLALDGNYPVLNLNHTATTNTNHGPTIQFTFDGYTSNRQIVIGTDGQGQRLDFGFSGGSYGTNSDKNPHRGISGYEGPTPMRLFSNGLLLGSTGVYPNEITSTSYALDVRGTGYASTDFRAQIFYDSNNTGYYFDGSSTGDSIRVAGDIVAYYSDARLKDFQGRINGALDKVLKINGYYYTENEKAKELGYNTGKTQVGVSAQEIEEVLPEVVKDAPIGHGYKTVQYERLVPLLIEAIKEQNDKIERLEAMVEKLINTHKG